MAAGVIIAQRTLRTWRFAIDVLAKYDPLHGWNDQHYTILYINPAVVDPVDRAKLEAWGWAANETFGCFVRSYWVEN